MILNWEPNHRTFYTLSNHVKGLNSRQINAMKQKRRDNPKESSQRPQNKKAKDPILMAHRDYALRLLTVGLVLVILSWTGLKYLLSIKGTTQIPFQSELILLAAGLTLFKGAFVFSQLNKAISQGDLPKIVRFSRLAFVANVIFLGIFLYFPAYTFGWLSSIYGFFGSDPANIQAWLPNWASTLSSILSTTVFGAIIFWALTSWAWDLLKQAGVTIQKIFIGFWQAPSNNKVEDKARKNPK